METWRSSGFGDSKSVKSPTVIFSYMCVIFSSYGTTSMDRMDSTSGFQLISHVRASKFVKDRLATDILKPTNMTTSRNDYVCSSKFASQRVNKHQTKMDHPQLRQLDRKFSIHLSITYSNHVL